MKALLIITTFFCCITVFSCGQTTGNTTETGTQAGFCEVYAKVVTSLQTTGDWLTTLKGAETDVAYYLPTNYTSMITMPGSLVSFIHQIRDDSPIDSANYSFQAILASEPATGEELVNKYNVIKDSLVSCAINNKVVEEFYNRYAQYDAYTTLQSGTTRTELNLYLNSNTNTWVILLSISNRTWWEEEEETD